MLRALHHTPQPKTSQPGLEKTQEASPLLIQQCLEMIKYFKISTFHRELEQCEKSSFLWLSIFSYQHIKLLGEGQKHLKAPKGHLPRPS